MKSFKIWREGESLPFGMGCIGLVSSLNSAVFPEIKKENPEKNEEQTIDLFISYDSHNYVVEEDLIPYFLVIHRNRGFVTISSKEEFFRIEKLLQDLISDENEEEEEEIYQEAYNSFIQIVDQGRLRDVSILHKLIQVGQEDQIPFLHEIEDYQKLIKFYKLTPNEFHFNKSNDELQKKEEEEEEEEEFSIKDISFFQKGISISDGLRQLYFAEAKVAQNIIKPFKNEFLSYALEKFGLLTEIIQVKAEISFEKVMKNGISIDLNGAQKKYKQLCLIREEVYNRLKKLNGFETLFSENKKGGPSISKSELRNLLKKACEQLEWQLNDTVEPPMDSNEEISVLWWHWKKYSSKHPFISDWLLYETTGREISFLEHLIHSEKVFPKYSLVRNGRHQASLPNIQHTPRDGSFRELFISQKGKKFIILDYTAIELCTLATVCETRYGFSILGNIIRNGTDPHSFTAAILNKMELQDFLKLKDSPNQEKRDWFQSQRQKAKGVNFGIPGGLGIPKLREYILQNFQVELSFKEAKYLKTEVITRIYPEFSLYLYEQGLWNLSQNLKTPTREIFTELVGDLTKQKSRLILKGMKNVLKGKMTKQTGEDYEPDFIEKTWTSLQKLNQNPKFENSLKERKGSQKLFEELFACHTTTLTGRVRGGISYTKALNTPFSGLAADGASLALWNLTIAGYKIVGFIHDEFIIEVDESLDDKSEIEKIEKIAIESMSEVVANKIPIKCATTVSHYWSKSKTKDTEKEDLPWDNEEENI